MIHFFWFSNKSAVYTFVIEIVLFFDGENKRTINSHILCHLGRTKVLNGNIFVCVCENLSFKKNWDFFLVANLSLKLIIHLEQFEQLIDLKEVLGWTSMNSFPKLLNANLNL